MEDEWERGGRVTGRQQDRVVSRRVAASLKGGAASSYSSIAAHRTAPPASSEHAAWQARGGDPRHVSSCLLAHLPMVPTYTCKVHSWKRCCAVASPSSGGCLSRRHRPAASSGGGKAVRPFLPLDLLLVLEELSCRISPAAAGRQPRRGLGPLGWRAIAAVRGHVGVAVSRAAAANCDVAPHLLASKDARERDHTEFGDSVARVWPAVCRVRALLCCRDEFVHQLLQPRQAEPSGLPGRL
eukprot:scaffold2072_cov126-Isochrysis_galbana.AAC.10